ncbi:Uncharacterized protein OBRU01_13054, partial [Operophtera brumata]
MEITPEAATNLAEDVSYKLRQMISSISLQSELMKKSRVDTWDVNTALALADTSPSMCTTANHFTQVGDEKIYTDVEELVNVCDLALTPQTCIYSSHPVLSTEWITDEKSQNHTSIYSKVAVRDLMTNTRIGPIFPNLFNLAVLVLNDDNLNALNVPAKKPLQSNVLDMVDALCSNPCSLDTNIQQQDRLTGPMIKCVMALGRQALYECLNSEDNLDHLDDCLMADKGTQQQAGLRATMLDVSTVLLRSEPTTYCEEYVGCDYVLIIPSTPRIRNGIHKDPAFEPTRFSSDTCIRLKIKNCRTIHVPRRHQAAYTHPSHAHSKQSIVVASGLLLRFKYKLNKPNAP